METALETATRLTTALERLAAEEAGCAAHHAYDRIAPLQERMGPVVEQLAALAPLAPAVVRERIAKILERRTSTVAVLAAHAGEYRERLQALDGRARTLRRVQPAYGGTARATSRLQALG